MRLIDADVLLNAMDKRYIEKKDIVPNNLAEGFMQMEKLIKEQPTAYDVEKVVATIDEALIEFEDGTNCGTCVFKELCDDGYDGCTQTIVAVCKDIVRKGGKWCPI